MAGLHKHKMGARDSMLGDLISTCFSCMPILCLYLAGYFYLICLYKAVHSVDDVVVSPVMK